MTNALELDQMELLPLTEGEIISTDGGLSPLVYFIAGIIISNWDDCVDGFRDGWNAY